MKRTTLNYGVDALAFVGSAFLVASGILLRYQLPPGSGRREALGQGQRALEKPVSVVWGLTRHEWGDVHYYLALGLMLVLSLHLFLHWKWVVCVTRGKPVEGSGYRLGLGVLGLVAVLALAAAPLVAPTERVTRAHLQPAIPEEPPDANSIEQEAIRGEMTLAEVEAATGVPCADLVERLGLPTTTSADEKLGRLRRQYGFEIQQVRQVISDYKTGDDQTK